MSTLVYLHGFMSSGKCKKSQIFSEYMNLLSDFNVISPDIDDDPSKSFKSIKDALRDCSNIEGIVGSSLGGFWGRLLARELQVPAVLINPVVNVKELIPSIVGKYTNPYTGKIFEINAHDGLELSKIEPSIDALDMNLLRIYIGLKDEVLDYNRGLSWFNGCDIQVIKNGDHYLLDCFNSNCPEIVHYFTNWHQKNKIIKN